MPAFDKPKIRYVALLGGINVGGHRVSMDRLRDLFTASGFADVSTFIASGNVLFSAASADTGALEETIEGHLQEALGYRVPTFLRTPEELTAVTAHGPFDAAALETPGHTLHVCFLRQAMSTANAEALLTYRTSMDDLHIHGRELYWLCRGNITDSLLKWPTISRKLGLSFTARNITSLRKLMTVV